MKNLFRKPYRWAIVFSIILTVSTAMVLLDTFVIPRAGTPVAATDETTSTDTQAADAETTDLIETTAITETTEGERSDPVITGSSYEDENIKITIETVYEYDTMIYIADIQVTNAEYLKTAFARDTYGRNYKEATSDIAESNGAILAINGDYYGFRDYGFVLRNGVLYRDIASEAGNDEALVIDKIGDFSVINENETDASALADENAWQIFSFGPTLINGGEIAVSEDTEVGNGRSMESNPRTAIGQISELHYIFIVSDGRTGESAGLSLYELARVMYDRGCVTAYNLDGGGSSTMWFNGEVINKPTTDGKSFAERSVSDIVYIGY